jgi:putative transposon-encoded protein
MRPVLKVNSRLNQARSVASIVKMDPDFAALVFPEVIRTVMARLLLQEADCEEDANENEWLVFSRNLVGEECVRYEDDLDCDKKSVEAYIERVVQSFGREADLVQRYIGFKTRSLQHENPLDGRTA